LALRDAGCTALYVDGSFVTTKERPGDYDACWDTQSVDLRALQQRELAFFQFDNKRLAQKIKFLGEFFPTDGVEKSTRTLFLEFFQVDKLTARKKGIVLLDLSDL